METLHRKKLDGPVHQNEHMGMKAMGKIFAGGRKTMASMQDASAKTWNKRDYSESYWQTEPCSDGSDDDCCEGPNGKYGMKKNEVIRELKREVAKCQENMSSYAEGVTDGVS